MKKTGNGERYCRVSHPDFPGQEFEVHPNLWHALSILSPRNYTGVVSLCMVSGQVQRVKSQDFDITIARELVQK